nr:hypothetical protein [Tanacetum cinerariifolium]
ALDEALVPYASRLRNRRSNFRLQSDISSKESTLQLMYDVLRLTPFFKAFLVTADVPEIYMQEFWTTATVHHHSIRHQNTQQFGAMLPIEITNADIRNSEAYKEYYAVATRATTLKTKASVQKTKSSFDTIVTPPPTAAVGTRLFTFAKGKQPAKASKAKSLTVLSKVAMTKAKQLKLAMKRSLQQTHISQASGSGADEGTGTIPGVPDVEHKDTRRAMRCIILGSQRNSDAYKEYYAVATGATHKTKASVWKTKSSFDTTVTPPLTAVVGPRLSTSAKGKQPATTSKAKSDDDDDDEEGDDGDDDEEGNDDDDDAQDDDDQEDEGDDDEDDQEEGSDDEQASDKEDEEFIHPSLSTHDEEETRDEESFDPVPKTPENTDDEDNGEENLRTNVCREEGHDKEEEEDELYRAVNINLGRDVQMADVHKTQEFKDSHVTLTSVNPDGQQQSSSVSSQLVTSMLNPTPDVGIKSIFETTSQMDVQTLTSVAPLPVSAPTLTPLTIATITTTQQAPTPPTTSPSTLLQDLPNFSSLFGFDHRLKTLEAKFSEFMQTN